MEDYFGKIDDPVTVRRDSINHEIGGLDSARIRRITQLNGEIHRLRVNHAGTTWVSDVYSTSRGCRCWRRARRTYRNQGPPATRRTTYAVAEVLIKTVVISLRARGCADAAIVAIMHLAVDHIEASLSFIQSQLEIGARYVAGRVIIHCAPFDVEDSIGRTAAYRSVNATGSTRVTGAARLRIGAQVGPVWEDCSVMATPRQANAR